MFCLQHIICPDPSSEDCSLYYRYQKNLSKIEPSSDKLTSWILRNGEKISLNSYYNAFSVSTWKERCHIHNLQLSIKGSGSVTLKLFHSPAPFSNILVLDREIKLDGEEQIIELNFWEAINGGFLYLTLEALTNVEITQLYFGTYQKPSQSVKLGIVITHFNRAQTLKPFVDRLKTLLLDKNLDKDIQLIIVDNSQNFCYECGSNNVKIIKNQNLGGSGGFSKGLSYLQDHAYTHCLFMDDDGYCREESLLRTYAFFAYSCDSANIAIAGTLFQKGESSLIHEVGGYFDYSGWHPILNQLNASEPSSLFTTEKANFQAQYGAWCYFAFPIKNIKYYPYPFFVRGDDVLFGLLNRFKIISINGIASRIDRFSSKNSPLTRYLDMRAKLVLLSVLPTFSRKKYLRLIKEGFKNHIRSYHYESAQAILLAVNDFLRGSETFSEDLTGTKFRQKIKSLLHLENNFQQIDRPIYIKAHSSFMESLVRSITCNGLLIPDFLLNRSTLFLNRDSYDNRICFKYKQVAFVDPHEKHYYVVQRNRYLFIKLYLNYIVTVLRLALLAPICYKKYNTSIKNLTKKSYWEKVFSKRVVNTSL